MDSKTICEMFFELNSCLPRITHLRSSGSRLAIQNNRCEILLVRRDQLKSIKNTNPGVLQLDKASGVEIMDLYLHQCYVIYIYISTYRNFR